MTAKTRAARHGGNHERAIVHGSRDSYIIPDERDRAWQIGTVAAGIIIMIAFGIMMCIGAWLGW
jgi:hypothetical protein